MATYKTDFREYTVGLAPADWSVLWGGFTVNEIVADAASPGGQYLKLDGQLSTYNGLTWDDIASFADGEALVLFSVPTLGGTDPVALRMGGLSGAEDFYEVNVTGSGAGNDPRIRKRVAGATTVLDEDTTFPWAADTQFWIRLSAVGTALEATLWRRGTPESGAVLLSAVDADLASGLAGLVAFSDGEQRYHYFAVDDAGGRAPTPLLVLLDDFDDNTRDTARWDLFNAAAATTVAETNGRIEITRAVSPAGLDENGYLSAESFDATNGEAYARVDVGATAAGILTWLQLRLDADNYYAVLQNNTSLAFRQRLAGVNDDTTIVYNASDHRWWKLAESGGNVTFETSPDGLTWTTRRTLAVGVAVDALKPALYASVLGTAPGGGTSTFDNFNVAPADIVGGGYYYRRFGLGRLGGML